ncbi:hypothetical protein RSK20926_06767 [Roseobacter sp. SK209-2-6]|uniref:hypothetical protein n=1 Tax=Roseobacter sp. SK209-2-6 TaxID=388739 RepID=UPI0000F3D870|nr:hypothetical protein [Roseobacter sp. SK209-2-6]EBA17418.1 hypothetical protein RSK20926_06767 [Roseobacter sp. SK209-2-6]
MGKRSNFKRRKNDLYRTPFDPVALHPLINHFAAMAPTWLLFDADWAFTLQSAKFRPLWRRYVAVGRVKWIAGSANTGKDNAAWYLFDQRCRGYHRNPEFVGRWAA